MYYHVKDIVGEKKTLIKDTDSTILKKPFESCISYKLPYNGIYEWMF